MWHVAAARVFTTMRKLCECALYIAFELYTTSGFESNKEHYGTLRVKSMSVCVITYPYVLIPALSKLVDLRHVIKQPFYV